MKDSFDLQRFVDAQDPVLTDIYAELRDGRKRSHWMWFAFPQLRGLGQSWMSNKYGISSRAEAEAYWRHPVLGPRLRECTELVNAVDGRTIEEIFGSIDALKFRSSMTLFAEATSENEIFVAALQKYFGGQRDQRTLDLLSRSRE